MLTARSTLKQLRRVDLLIAEWSTKEVEVPPSTEDNPHD